MDKKIIAIISAIIVIVAGVGVYVMTDNRENNKQLPDTVGETVTDAVGREVTVPSSLENGIVTIGSCGSLRFLSMFGVVDKVIETDKGDVTDNRNGRGYSYAYPINTRTSDQYHDDNKLESATVESIAKKNPSLVVVDYNVYQNYKENCNTLAKKCTLIVIWAQQMTYMTDDKGDLADYFKNNVNMLGTVLGMKNRSAQLISGIKSIIDDISSYKGTSSDKVYVAGVTINGSNTLNTTFPTYLPFTMNSVQNAYNGSSTASKVVLNMDGPEFVNNTNIDIIVIDPSSSDKIVASDSQAFLKYIHGINNDSDNTNDIPLYITIPIVWDSINYDCSLASAYYIESVVYGTLTAEEAKGKIVNIFNTFYGEAGNKVFDDMSSFFVKKSSDNGQEMPLLKEVKVVKEGSTYRIVTA